MASALRDWLPEVIQEVEPWMSSEDIAKGRRWSAEVAKTLQSTTEGIVCVTARNQSEPWLSFEAGALAKSVNDAQVRPLLLGIAAHELVGPLAEFQATLATDAGDMLQLVRSLNSKCDRPLGDGLLQRVFDRAWPDILDRFRAIEAHDSGPTDLGASRPESDVVAEILERVRGIERRVPAGRTTRPFARAKRDHSGLLGEVRRLYAEIFGESPPVMRILEFSNRDVFSIVLRYEEDHSPVKLEDYARRALEECIEQGCPEVIRVVVGSGRGSEESYYHHYELASDGTVIDVNPT